MFKLIVFAFAATAILATTSMNADAQTSPSQKQVKASTKANPAPLHTQVTGACKMQGRLQA